MNHKQAFLQAIRERPHDDAPRLIYADWLEEQGGAPRAARADFIRIQCALTAGKVPEQQRAELVRLEQQLLDDWGRQWDRPIRRLAREWNFHRGFIDDVAIFTDAFLAHAGRLFRLAPIQHLTLRQSNNPTSRYMAALAENEHLRRLRSLNLSTQGLESGDVRALVVSKHLTGLISLNLSGNRIGDGGIRALANSPLLGQLERLNLRNNDIGANGLRVLARALEALADSPDGLRLQWLELYYPNLSAAGQRVIADSPVLRRVLGI
jgi:uncharacterized protein (TIGR02996 family)